MSRRVYNGKPVNKKKGRPLLTVEEMTAQNRMWDNALKGVKVKQVEGELKNDYR